jgi:hypothetical protein
MASEVNDLLIVAFISDLVLAARVEDAAGELEYRLVWIEGVRQLVPPAVDTALVDIEMILLEKLTAWRPALMIFDLGNVAVPWRRWVALIKSSPATRRYPLICFGSQADAAALRSARSSGAEVALPHSRLMTDLPALIQQYARRSDPAALISACQAGLSPQAVHGLELFNQGKYFEAHEELEEAWIADETPGRDLYRAILQVGVAYLQVERGNYQGALKMFLRVRQWIDPLPERCRGVDIARLRADASAVYEQLIALGPEGIAEFDRRLFKPVVYTLAATSD